MSVFICENCNKEFQIGYGTNRFCSRSCCASFNAKKYNPEKKLKSLEKARAAKKLYSEERKKNNIKNEIKGNCMFCNKECKNQNSLRNHERLCSENPNRQLTALMLYNHDGRHKRTNQYVKAKQLGLPKPQISDETRRKLSECIKGRKHSEEVKRKISETMKKRFVDSGDRSIWHTQLEKRKSFAEDYFDRCLPGFEYNYHVDRYFLDIANPSLKLYIEIDGEQHYNDKKVVEHDRLRTQRLAELGWCCVRRVRWAEYKRLSEKDQKSLIEDLKSKLNDPTFLQL